VAAHVESRLPPYVSVRTAAWCRFISAQCAGFKRRCFRGAGDRSVCHRRLPLQIPVDWGMVRARVSWCSGLSAIANPVNGLPTWPKQCGLCLKAMQSPQVRLYHQRPTEDADAITMTAPFPSIKHPFAVDSGAGPMGGGLQLRRHFNLLYFSAFYRTGRAHQPSGRTSAAASSGWYYSAPTS